MQVYVSFCLGVWLLCLSPLSAQLTDDFSDGDFSNNPAWSGESTLFQVSASNELQTDGNSAADTIYLSTDNARLDDTEWRFMLRYSNNPSTSNFMRVYLVSDQSNLEGSLNGYFLQAGGESGANDSYDLYRQDGSSITQIIDGIDGRANGVDVIVKVLRDPGGTWEVYTDINGSGNFVMEGSVMDLTHINTQSFGVWVKHTSSNRANFFFDDFYIGDEIVDLTPPDFISASPVTSTIVEVQFSESLDQTSAENTTNYQLNQGIGTPVSAQRDANDFSLVRLTLATPLVNTQSYTITVSAVADMSGNAMTTPQSQSFTYLVAELATFKDIIINEIFADPTPSRGLPEAEYLELFNRSTKVIDLENWTISNGSRVGSLPQVIVQPGEYVILSSASDTAKWTTFGRVLAPSSWPALVNGGDNLGLRNAAGTAIDSVDYELAWYNNPVKEEGGFSLELIYPDNLDCPGKANWTATVNSNGGTPGIFNSVIRTNAETDPPDFISAATLAPDIVEVCFSEPMDVARLANTANYVVGGGIGSPVSVTIQEPDRECVELQFSPPLQQGIVYELQINNLVDCSGNALDSVKTSLVVGKPALAFEVVFSEIFADPSPQLGLPEAEFVEIVNRTNEVLDLSNYLLRNGSTLMNLGSLQLFTGEAAIICEESVADLYRPFGKVVPVSNWSALNNTTDSLELLNAFGQPIDYVFYHKSWYLDSEKAEGGWTLEKIDPDYMDCNQPENWRAATAPVGGTPGQTNSIDGTYTDGAPPGVLSFRLIEDNILELTFSEQMDPQSLNLPAQYQVDQGIGSPLIANAKSPDYRIVRLTFDAAFQPQVLYELTLSQLTDCAGNGLNETLTFGLPDSAIAGDVKINEILFNPYSGASDFVEIVNTSTKVLDVKDLLIGEIFEGTDSIFNADPLSSISRLLLPGQILCLTANVAVQRQIYLPPGSANFLEMASFPTYDDSDGECVIFTTDGQVLDRFYYEDDFHFPTLDDDEGVSLERLSAIRPTEDPNNWHSAASTVRFATPGYENSQLIDGTTGNTAVTIEPETFSPDLDGVDDVLAIHYDFDFPGANARISVLDAQGRLIKIVSQNALLGTDPGTLFWDGTNSKGVKADIGMYIILFEVSNQQTGERMVFKEVAVLAARF